MGRRRVAARRPAARQNDWGSLTTGDPAADDAAVARARGWVISQAVIALPYYRDTNPGIVAQSLRALAAVLS